MKIKQLVKEKPTMLINMKKLLGWYNSIVEMQQKDSFMEVVNRNQINEFLIGYGKKCEDTIMEIKAMNARYYETGENGEFIFKDGKPVLKGLAKEELYNEELSLILNRPVEYR